MREIANTPRCPTSSGNRPELEEITAPNKSDFET
jgi:hypothetical protein